jgi:hypothetical protein
MTDQPASLAEALAALQTRLPRIGKDKTAKVVPKDKAPYSYDYANLATISAAVLPLMGPLGLSFTTRPTMSVRHEGTDQFVLIYQLLHISGEDLSGEYPLPDPARTTPQQVGSAITYARRYCLCAVTGVAADEDDDDAQAAAQAPRAARGKPPERAAGNQPRNRDGSTSRSRVTDDELAATGQMTAAQVRDHGQLERDVKGSGPQGTQRLAETPADDLFYDQAALRAPRAAGNPVGVIQAHFKRLGYTDSPEDRTARLKRLSAITGRPITSTNDLTAAEGLTVKDLLQKCRDVAALDEALAVKAGEDIA